MVQPDVLVICDREKITGRVCFGAPDLVIEVLSPSSRRHDAVRKLAKYRNAGVREYWITDPETEKVLVYRFGEEREAFLYGFTEHVPVWIAEGKCVIDFSEVQKAML